MTIVQDLKGVQRDDVTIALGLLMSIVSSGALAILLYQRSLLTEMGALPLLILACSIGLPAFVANYVICAAVNAVISTIKARPHSHHVYGVLTASMIVCNVVFHGALATAFLHHLTVREFVGTLTQYQFAGVAFYVGLIWLIDIDATPSRN